MTRTSAVPYRPDYAAARSRTSAPIWRGAVAALLSQHKNRPIDQIQKEHYPQDEGTALMTRAAVTSGTTTTPGWAAEIVGHGVADIVNVLAGASAGAACMARGLQFFYDGGYNALQIPTFTAASTDSSFVSQGSNVPVRKFDFSKFVSLPHRKLATINAWTRELFQHSTPSIETAVRTTLTESLALTIDTKMFDATVGDATRPQGLLNGINVTSASANSDHNQAMLEDCTTLAGIVSAVAANGPIIFVAASKQAIALRLRAPREFPYEVFPCAALADGVVICLAANCLVSAADPVPRFSISKEALLVMDDAPTDVVASGGTAFSGGPVKSLFQVDAIGLRTILQINWGLRSATGLAWTSSVLW